MSKNWSPPEVEGWAKPGDTIRITYRESTSFGKTFLVVECPDEYKHYVGCYAWVYLDHGPAAFLIKEYEIVNDTKTKQSHHKDEKSVDESLDKQRDDNLRHAFGF